MARHEGDNVRKINTPYWMRLLATITPEKHLSAIRREMGGSYSYMLNQLKFLADKGYVTMKRTHGKSFPILTKEGKSAKEIVDRVKDL